MLLFKNLVLFLLFVEQEGVPIREVWYVIGYLHLVVNELVSELLGFSETIPEMNGISPVLVQKQLYVGSER